MTLSIAPPSPISPGSAPPFAAPSPSASGEGFAAVFGTIGNAAANGGKILPGQAPADPVTLAASGPGEVEPGDAREAVAAGPPLPFRRSAETSSPELADASASRGSVGRALRGVEEHAPDSDDRDDGEGAHRELPQGAPSAPIQAAPLAPVTAVAQPAPPIAANASPSIEPEPLAPAVVASPVVAAAPGPRHAETQVRASAAPLSAQLTDEPAAAAGASRARSAAPLAGRSPAPAEPVHAVAASVRSSARPTLAATVSERPSLSAERDAPASATSDRRGPGNAVSRAPDRDAVANGSAVRSERSPLPSLDMDARAVAKPIASPARAETQVHTARAPAPWATPALLASAHEPTVPAERSMSAGLSRAVGDAGAPERAARTPALSSDSAAPEGPALREPLPRSLADLVASAQVRFGPATASEPRVETEFSPEPARHWLTDDTSGAGPAPRRDKASSSPTPHRAAATPTDTGAPVPVAAPAGAPTARAQPNVTKPSDPVSSLAPREEPAPGRAPVSATPAAPVDPSAAARAATPAAATVAPAGPTSAARAPLPPVPLDTAAQLARRPTAPPRMAASRPVASEEIAPPALTTAGVLAANASAAAPVAQPAALDMTRYTWPAAMVARIERLRDAAEEVSTAIRLIPDALGAIDVSLKKEGEITHVHLAADQPQTRALLAEATPKLAELAEQRGLRLGDAQVHSGPGSGGHQQASAQTGQQPAPRRSAPPAAVPQPEPSTPDDRIA